VPFYKSQIYIEWYFAAHILVGNILAKDMPKVKILESIITPPCLPDAQTRVF